VLVGRHVGRALTTALSRVSRRSATSQRRVVGGGAGGQRCLVAGRHDDCRVDVCKHAVAVFGDFEGPQALREATVGVLIGLLEENISRRVVARVEAGDLSDAIDGRAGGVVELQAALAGDAHARADPLELPRFGGAGG